MSHRVFVYGTLLSGEENHHVLRGATFVGHAQTAARYELRDLGPYPALVEGGDQAIAGEVYEVDDAGLAALDAFEECPQLYRRVRIRLEGGSEVESYVQTAEQAAARPRIVSGDWRLRPR